MADLIVVGFKKDMYGASKVLNELIEWTTIGQWICMAPLPPIVTIS